jgi:2-polyprenyl-6-methoxyphenol hydroxylase-like FAD-dependent oxidoreductase
MWMRLTRQPDDPAQTFGHFGQGRILILLNRDDYWQCAFVIPKGAADEVRQRGMPALHGEIASLAPFLQDRMGDLHNWNQVSVLTVTVDRLSRWFRSGLLCIGDAAHAMSPIGGVGINLAIQDAVAAANILGPKLAAGILSEKDLQAVQERRTFPTHATQRLQLAIQNQVIRRVLGSDQPLRLAWPFKLLKSLPSLRRIPARLIGIGFRPEHLDLQPAAEQAGRPEGYRAA